LEAFAADQHLVAVGGLVGAGELPAAGGEVAQIQPPFWWQKNDQGITAEQAKQSTQAIDLGFWVGLAGLEPATERL
jgi:hypothetical protein